MLFSTRGGLTYFSPDTLESRYQSERLVPLLQIPIYRSGFGYYRKDIVNYLIEHDYWQPNDVEHPRWIPASHWNDAWRDGYSALGRELGRSEYWINWSDSHPELASIVWPLVLRALRELPESSQDVVAAVLLYSASVSENVDQLIDHLESSGEVPQEWIDTLKPGA